MLHELRLEDSSTIVGDDSDDGGDDSGDGGGIEAGCEKTSMNNFHDVVMKREVNKRNRFGCTALRLAARGDINDKDKDDDSDDDDGKNNSYS